MLTGFDDRAPDIIIYNATPCNSTPDMHTNLTHTHSQPLTHIVHTFCTRKCATFDVYIVPPGAKGKVLSASPPLRVRVPDFLPYSPAGRSSSQVGNALAQHTHDNTTRAACTPSPAADFCARMVYANVRAHKCRGTPGAPNRTPRARARHCCP